MVDVLGTIFANAAAPQRCLFVALASALVLAPVLTALVLCGQTQWRSALSELRLIAPLVGLLIAGMDSFHMARTILKLPSDVTARQLAPGLLEVSTFVVMGVVVGLVAQAGLILTDMRARNVA